MLMQLQPATKKRIEIATLGIMLCAFFIFCWMNIRLPGPQMDTLLHVPNAIHILNPNSPSLDVTDYNGTFFEINNADFPLVLHSYSGAIRTYLLTFWYAVLGISVEATRLFTIILAIGILISAYIFCRRTLNPFIAILTVTLLATDINFITYARADNGAIILPLFFKSMALACLSGVFITSPKSQAKFPLLLAGILLGLGVYERTYPLWYAVSYSIVLGGFVLFKLIRLDKIRYLLFLSGIALGLTPLIIYNVLYDFPLLALLRSGGPRTNENISLLSKVGRTFELVHVVLQGNAPFRLSIISTGSESIISNFLKLIFPFVFWISFISSLIISAKKILNTATIIIIFLILTNIIEFIFVVVTPSTDGAHHIMMLYPHPQILVALFIGSALQKCDKQRLVLVLMSMITLILVANLANVMRFHSALLLGNFKPSWGDAIYSASEYVEQMQTEDEDPIYILDWGISRAFMLLSEGDIFYREIFWEIQDILPQDHYDYFQYLIRIGSSFIYYETDYEIYPQTKGFILSFIEESGIPYSAEAFFDRNGQHTLTILTTEPNP